MSDGSERSDYLPQAKALDVLGSPHAGINLMACYYPKQEFWPERRLFSDDVPHYRHAPKDETAFTKMECLNEWTDGYYNLDIKDPNCAVIQQMEDVRRYGQDVRLTLTADMDTSDDDLRAIAEILKPFGKVELRLNHEANGNNWFRFAQNVGALQGQKQIEKYYAISQFFLRANTVIRDVAPEVVLVGCYNGPGERTTMGELAPGELPHLTLEELGLMYQHPDTMVSLDQYGSLHYGWPGHTIGTVPVIDGVNHQEHQSFSLTSLELCETVIRPFHTFIEELRGKPTRIDLGELDFDEDIHGPEIRAHLLYECYNWVRKHPEIVGSVTFYELTDMGGLGLFRQKAYGNLDELSSNIVTDFYKRVLKWEEFEPKVETIRALSQNAENIELEWISSSDATGLEIELDPEQAKIDFLESTWKRIIFIDKSGTHSYLHTSAEKVNIPRDTQSVRIFALPEDGRNNTCHSYTRTIPVPR